MDLSLLLEKAKMIVVPSVIAIWLFINKYKSIASEIALRIEKDTKDGDWSHKEKEGLAIDVYKKVRKSLPIYLWFLKVFPPFITTPIIKWLIKKLCKKSHKIKKLPNK